jgi:hypothetical protein
MNNQSYSLERKWVEVGIMAGFIASFTYPIMVFVPLPRMLTITFGAAFGPALAIASIGLYYFLKSERETVAAQIGAFANMVAGALVTAMILVQLAIRWPQLDHLAEFGKDQSIQTVVDWTWYVVLGLDVSFDVFIAIGTFCFALRMLKHPRFGAGFGIIGMLIAVGFLLGLNFYTFPYPPRDAGLTVWDPGPPTALWYLAVTIQLWRSLKWFRDYTRTP